jgi:small subunit ribosomal protein S10
MASTKFVVKLKSYDYRLLDQSAKKIVEAVKKTGVKIVGPVPLPTSREVFTVLRSPHVNKDSREQFERRTHKRLIEIIDPTPKTISVLTALDMPSGVDIVVKTK